MKGTGAVCATTSCTMILLDPDLAAAKPNTPKTEAKDRVPSARTLTRFLREAQAAVRLKGMVSVLLTTDLAIRRLNRQFRGKNKATDVLSFPAGEEARGEVAGDLAISVPTALKQAREHGHALGVELKVLMLHGLLHLAGYDHEVDEGEMARRERRLRGRLGLPEGLIERADTNLTRTPKMKRPKKAAAGPSTQRLDQRSSSRIAEGASDSAKRGGKR